MNLWAPCNFSWTAALLKSPLDHNIYLEIGQNVFILYEIADIQDGMSTFFGCLALLACSCDHKYGYGLHDKIMFIIKKKVLI